MQVKAIACELPATLGVPLSRLSCADIVREAQRSGIVATLSDKTVWRWLHEDAIRPWQHRTWIFPRDPQFISKAGRLRGVAHKKGKSGKATWGDREIYGTKKELENLANLARRV